MAQMCYTIIVHQPPKLIRKIPGNWSLRGSFLLISVRPFTHFTILFSYCVSCQILQSHIRIILLWTLQWLIRKAHPEIGTHIIFAWQSIHHKGLLKTMISQPLHLTFFMAVTHFTNGNIAYTTMFFILLKGSREPYLDSQMDDFTCQ